MCIRDREKGKRRSRERKDGQSVASHERNKPGREQRPRGRRRGECHNPLEWPRGSDHASLHLRQHPPVGGGDCPKKHSKGSEHERRHGGSDPRHPNQDSRQA